MKKLFDYLIIGGGMTAAAAAQGIREADLTGTIGILAAEEQPPYSRPPLTKKLWQGKPEAGIWRKLPSQNLELLSNCRATQLDPSQKQVFDEAGNTYTYNKLLLATGGSPRTLPFAPETTLYFRTLADYHALRSWTGQGKRFGIIGGGFIGSEIAAALSSTGEEVTMAFPEESIGAAVYPPDLANFVTGYYREQGVEVHPKMQIQEIEPMGNRYVLRSKDNQAVEVDHIVAGIGIRPNIELAKSAAVAISAPEEGGGIYVDEFLRTNYPDIYASGDVASFYNPALGRRMRVEHEDNALTMGRTAGQNMAGREVPYQHQPFFYSDMFDLGYEAVGELNPRLQTVADWKDPFRQGVVYYMKGGLVRGVLLWNTWDQVDAARQVIAGGKKYKEEDLKGLLPA